MAVKKITNPFAWNCVIFADSTLLVHVIKEIMTENQAIISHYQYPDPGSNRDGLLHWCLRPARLPIPPSGLLCGAKVMTIFLLCNIGATNFVTTGNFDSCFCAGACV